MNDQQTLARFDAAVQALRVETWTAWRLGERESYPIALADPETLDEALHQALTGARNAGEMLAIQCSHAGRGKHTLWLYAIKRSTKNGTWRDSTNGGRRVFVGNLEPKLVQQVALAVPFAPVRPFDAFRDDAVGRDLQLVEARS